MATLARETISFALNGGAEQADMSLSWFSPADSVANLVTSLGAEIDPWWTSVSNYYQQTVAVVDHVVRVIDIVTGQTEYSLPVALPSPAVGLDEGKQLPLQCAPVMSLKTGLAGGSFRGRMYFPPVSTNIIDEDGYMQSVYRNAIVTATALFMNDVQADTGWEPGIYSRTLAAFTPLTSIDMGSVIDTQRRRRSELIEQRFSALV